MLGFNESTAKAAYLRDNPRLQQDEQLLERLLQRHELLSRNPLFIEEWTTLNKIKADGPHEKYREAQKEFTSRWHIYPSGLHSLVGYPGAPVKVINADYTGKITLEINLNISKTALLEEISKEISSWQNSWEEVQTDGINETHPYNDALAGNKIDIKLIEKYLKVWTMKQNGCQPKQIRKELDLTKDNVRDYLRAAQTLIEQGLPGFPAFPTDR